MPTELLCEVMRDISSVHDLRNLADAHPALEAVVRWRIKEDQAKISIKVYHQDIFIDHCGSRTEEIYSRTARIHSTIRIGADQEFPTFASLWDLYKDYRKSIRLYVPHTITTLQEEKICRFADTIYHIHTSNHILEEVLIFSDDSYGLELVNYMKVDPLIRFVLFNFLKDTSIPTIIEHNFFNFKRWGGIMRRRIQMRTRIHGIPW